MKTGSCLSIIDNHYQRLTKTERVIADYILANPNQVIYSSVYELADITQTSAAAISRFARAIGFKGFSDFKLALANKGQEATDEYDDIIKSSDSLRVINQKILSSIKRSLDDTFLILKEDVLASVIDKIIHARMVYIMGHSISGIVALDFKQRLERIGINVFYDADPHITMSALAYCNEKDVILAVSYSGKRKIINQMVSYAKRANACIVSVTGVTKNPLSKLSDYNLIIPVKEPEKRIAAINSRMACLAILDVVYMGIIKTDLEGISRKIQKTKEAVNLLDL